MVKTELYGVEEQNLKIKKILKKKIKAAETEENTLRRLNSPSANIKTKTK